MRILFDHGTPSGIAKALSGHEVTEALIAAGRNSPTANSYRRLRKKALISCSRRIRTSGISKT
jgi:hypothetical protein